VVIERGDALTRELDPVLAFDTLSDNTEDAYGFPPYPRIQDSLRDGWVERERDIRRQVVAGLQAVLLRTPDRAWFELLPGLVAGSADGSGEVVQIDRGGDVFVDLTTPTVADDGDAVPLDAADADTIASRFAKLSPEEAAEVEHALSSALAMLQKVSDILEGQSEREAVSGLVAEVRSLRDARASHGKG
jgi:hypothetical protein